MNDLNSSASFLRLLRFFEITCSVPFHFFFPSKYGHNVIREAEMKITVSLRKITAEKNGLGFPSTKFLLNLFFVNEIAEILGGGTVVYFCREIKRKDN